MLANDISDNNVVESDSLLGLSGTLDLNATAGKMNAISWKTEGDYFAVSENGMETSVLTREQNEMCLGSSTFRICHQTMETQLGRSSCLANPFWPNPVATLTVCETEKVILPTPEKATDLGYGIWLITSASSSFSLWEYNLNEVHTPSRKEHSGCNICVITLDCRTQLASRNIKIRPDLGSCDEIPARRINVKLSDPLEHLMSEIPEIKELPYFGSRTCGDQTFGRSKSEAYP